MHDQTFASTEVAVRVALFSPEEELALAGFLAGYSGLTREAYALDLRQYVTWCTEQQVVLFGARRADIESFGRHLETLGRARATIARRLCTITAFYRYAEEEGLIADLTRGACPPTAPRLRVARDRPGPQRGRRDARRRRPRRRPRPRTHQPAGPQRTAGLRSHRRRHRSPRPRTRPPDPDHPAQRRQDRHHPARAPHRPRHRPRRRRTLRRADLRRDRRSNVSTATPRAGSCVASPARPGSPSGSDPTPCATRSSPPRSTPASRCATSKKPPATPILEPRCATTEPASPSTDTPPTSSPPSSPAPPDSPIDRPLGSRKNAPERALCAPLAVYGPTSSIDALLSLDCEQRPLAWYTL